MNAPTARRRLLGAPRPLALSDLPAAGLPPARASWRERAAGAFFDAIAPAASDALARSLPVSLRLDLRAVEALPAGASTLLELDWAWHGRASAPASGWALLGLNPAAAHALAGLLLGRAPEPARLLRPLTELEAALVTAQLARAFALVPPPLQGATLALQPQPRAAELRLLASRSVTLATLRLTLGDVQGLAWVVLASPLKERLPATFTPRRAAPPGLPVEVELHLASLHLPAGELRRLAPGALLLGVRLGAPEALRASLVIGREPWLGGSLELRSPPVLRLTQRLSAPQEARPMTPAPLAPLLAPAELERLPITLNLRVARWSLPLAELASLQPGDLLALPHTAEALRVTLAAGERDLALGELVEVEGQLAVRLLRLLDDPDAPVAPERSSAL